MVYISTNEDDVQSLIRNGHDVNRDFADKDTGLPPVVAELSVNTASDEKEISTPSASIAPERTNQQDNVNGNGIKKY